MIWLFMASPNWGKRKEAKKKTNLLDKIGKMDMAELREFVKENNLKAKDTRRNELVDEIISELKTKGMI